MKLVLQIAALVTGLSVSLSAFAALPPAVAKAASEMKSSSVRVRVTRSGGNGPCDMDYLAVIQVKQAMFDHIKERIVYSWETVKTIGIDKDGGVMEACAE